MPHIARRGINCDTPMTSHLYGDMCGRSEAVKTYPSSGFDPGEPQRTKSDNSRAKQRRGLLVGKLLWNGIYKTFWRDDGLGIATVHCVASELRAIAKIFRARSAVLAGPVGFVQPGNSHTRTDGKSSRVFAQLLDGTDNLVSRDDRRLPWRQFAFNHVQVRAAYRASMHPHEYFAFTRQRSRNLPEFQWIGLHLRSSLQNTRFHRETSVAATGCST